MAREPKPADTGDILRTFRPEDATPEDLELLIDARVSRIDEEIATHQATVESLRAERKRWLAVTGGRSRIGNGPEAMP